MGHTIHRVQRETTLLSLFFPLYVLQKYNSIFVFVQRFLRTTNIVCFSLANDFRSISKLIIKTFCDIVWKFSNTSVKNACIFRLRSLVRSKICWKTRQQTTNTQTENAILHERRWATQNKIWHKMDSKIKSKYFCIGIVRQTVCKRILYFKQFKVNCRFRAVFSI